VIVDATIQQLRTYCPPFGGRVAGAADFQQGLKNYNANMALPAAYVILLDQESDGNHNMVGLYQFVRKTIGVVVELDATGDRRGQAPAMSTEAIQTALNLALLNWPPAMCLTVNQQGYWFSGGRPLDLDRARLFYQFEFALNTVLDDTDGWQPPSVPLESIEVDIFKVPPQDMLVDEPAAIVKIATFGSIWDGGQSLWDGGLTTWDQTAVAGSIWDGDATTWDNNQSLWDWGI
jgi:hypothetical protein